MTELIIVSIVVLAALAAVVYVSREQSKRLERAWQAGYRGLQDIKVAQSARITTLENRLDSRSWQEFDALQRTPDELAKQTFAQQWLSPHDLGEPVNESWDPDDLEGEFTGPTVG